MSTLGSRRLRLIGLVVLVAVLGVAALMVARRQGPASNVIRAEYRSFGQTASVIPTEAGKAGPNDGAGVLGPSYQPSRPGVRLKLRVLFNGLLTSNNELVVAVFRQGEGQPLAVASRPGAAGERVTVDRTLAFSATTTAPVGFEVRVGLARPSGQVYLNGGPSGPDTSWPPSYIEIGEERGWW